MWVLSSAEPKLAEVTTGWEYTFKAAEKVVKEVKAERISRELRQPCENTLRESAH